MTDSKASHVLALGLVVIVELFVTFCNEFCTDALKFLNIYGNMNRRITKATSITIDEENDNTYNDRAPHENVG